MKRQDLDELCRTFLASDELAQEWATRHPKDIEDACAELTERFVAHCTSLGVRAAPVIVLEGEDALDFQGDHCLAVVYGDDEAEYGVDWTARQFYDLCQVEPKAIACPLIFDVITSPALDYPLTKVSFDSSIWPRADDAYLERLEQLKGNPAGGTMDKRATLNDEQIHARSALQDAARRAEDAAAYLGPTYDKPDPELMEIAQRLHAIFEQVLPGGRGS